MKAQIFLESAIEKALAVAILLTTVPFTYPEAALAAEVHADEARMTQSLLFEVKPNQKENLIHGPQLTYDEIIAQDPLVQKLTAYLEKHNATLAKDAHKITTLPQWQRALAISFVESNFCEKAKNNNCGSLGVAPGHKLWRRYPTKFDGLADLSRLLEKPMYKERLNTCQKMKGVYVVPGSSRWVNGCNKISNDLVTLTREAEAERAALISAASGSVVASSIHTELAYK